MAKGSRFEAFVLNEELCALLPGRKQGHTEAGAGRVDHRYGLEPGSGETAGIGECSQNCETCPARG